MTWGAVATIGGALIAGQGAKSAARTSAQAQDRAAELAYQQSLPWTTTGLFGSAEFDEDTREATLGLSDEWKSVYDQKFGDYADQRGERAGFESEFERQRGLAIGSEGRYDDQMARVGGAQADFAKQKGLIAGTEADYAKQMGYASQLEGDPMAAGKKFYDMQKAIYAPEQEKARLSQESRLLAQGRLGSTGGAGEIEALRKSQGQVDLQAQYDSLDKAQQMTDLYRGRGREAQQMTDIYRGRGREAQQEEDTYRLRAAQEDQRTGMFRDRSKEEQGYVDLMRSREASDLDTAKTIGGMPLEYANLGRGIGSQMSSVASKGADLRSQAAMGQGAADANLWGGIGRSVAGANWGGMLGNRSYMPTYGTSTTGANSGGYLYGQSPMGGFSVD